MTDDPEITNPRDPYKRRDIVAELDRWLRVYDFAGLIDVAVIQRARDEIVALRAEQEAVRGIAGNERRLSEAIAQQARDEAHEELQAARREIVALRRTIMLGPDLPALARDEALEEAAQACTDQTSDDPPPGTYNDACEDCAAAIRALKDKGHG